MTAADSMGMIPTIRGEETVVEEPIGVIPQSLVVHGLRDGGEVLEELDDKIGGWPPPAALQDAGDGGHGNRVEGHPAGGIGLLKDSADRQVRTVDGADVVQAEEAALEHIVAARVLQVDPPVEVEQELIEDPAQEVEVAAAVDGEHLERGPGLHRRVHVAEIPLVGGQRPVRMLEPLPAEQDQLVLGKRRVDVGQGNAVEGKIPGGEPRVLPLVRHGHEVERIERAPPGVAPAAPARRGGWLGGVTIQPAADVVVVKLLAPQQPGEGLAHHHRLVGASRFGGEFGVELVGLGPALLDDLVEVAAERSRRALLPASRSACRPQPQPQLGGFAGRDRQAVPERALGPALIGVDGGRAADHMIVDPVLRVRRGWSRTEQVAEVGLVLAKQRDRAWSCGR
jgi:hypothetical protein